MTRATWIELAYVIVALALSCGVVVATRGHALVLVDAQRHAPARSVVDATGQVVTPRTFRRLASGSLLADRLLIELAEPERIVGLSRYGFHDSAFEHQYGERAHVDPNGDLEALVALGPDLLLVNNFVDPGRVARLRESGIVVFDLGEMQGRASLVEDVRLVGRLLGAPERGERLATQFETRLDSVAADVPASERPRAIYLGIHGTQIYGGARGTSYHDVIEAAGLIDAAAERYRGWPSLSSEDVLALGPTVIVTQNGRGASICHHVGLESLPACTRPGGIVEVDERVLVDPGLTMLDAAEAIRLAVHGRPGSRRSAR